MRRPSSNSSFSLLEITFTLALSAVLLMAIFASIATSIKSRNFTREREVALEAARAKLEVIQDMAATGQYAQILALDGTTFPAPNPADFPGTVGADELPSTARLTGEDGSGSDPGRVSVTDLANATIPTGPLPTSMKVTVLVLWRSGGEGVGGTSRVELATIVTDRQ